MMVDGTRRGVAAWRHIRLFGHACQHGLVAPIIWLIGSQQIQWLLDRSQRWATEGVAAASSRSSNRRRVAHQHLLLADMENDCNVGTWKVAECVVDLAFPPATLVLLGHQENIILLEGYFTLRLWHSRCVIVVVVVVSEATKQ